jgi:hypothetical protein
LVTFPTKFHTPDPEALLPVLFPVAEPDDEEIFHDELFE